MTEEPRTCPDCDYYSASYRACFNPATWHQGEFFKVPGDPLVWNPGGRCKMFEVSRLYAGVKKSGKLSKLIRRMKWAK